MAPAVRAGGSWGKRKPPPPPPPPPPAPFLSGLAGVAYTVVVVSTAAAFVWVASGLARAAGARRRREPKCEPAVQPQSPEKAASPVQASRQPPPGAEVRACEACQAPLEGEFVTVGGKTFHNRRVPCLTTRFIRSNNATLENHAASFAAAVCLPVVLVHFRPKASHVFVCLFVLFLLSPIGTIEVGASRVLWWSSTCCLRPDISASTFSTVKRVFGALT